ncbi:hypothetical protein [Clostridium ljungdahlii]|uniref:hypothetical protein n=1 Tax=Clostridium ljungdahlii TaxID=1538 RepID=UPI00178CE9C5|nr:hypothetical protein [Clostridium ljungdahlii]
MFSRRGFCSIFIKPWNFVPIKEYYIVTMSSYYLTIGTPRPNDKVVTNVGTDLFYLKRNDVEWYKNLQTTADICMRCYIN